MVIIKTIDPDAEKGIQLFNESKYFEAHEALELAWRREVGDVRNLYKGIIQAAVFYLHITRKNYPGAIKVYQRCMKWLAPWPDVYLGIHIGQLKKDLEITASKVLALKPNTSEHFDLSLLKPILYTPEDTSLGSGSRQFFCDRCGTEMEIGNCKITCPNCGNRFDCSDLNLYFD